MTKNLKQLLKETNSYENENDKISFIMNYLLDTVKYDYNHLLVNNLLKGTIKKFSKQKVEFSRFEKGIKDNKNVSFIRIKNIEEGESRLFNNIINLQSNSSTYESFISKLNNLLKQEMKCFLNNDVIINDEIDILISKIKELSKQGAQINFINDNYLIKNDISYILSEFILDTNFYFKPEFNKDLLIKGTSDDFIKYLMEIMSLLKIEYHKLCISNGLEYPLLYVLIDGKYKVLDLTDSIFIRDKMKDKENKKIKDYLITDLKKLFKIEPNLKIISIDDNQLKVIINKDNYKEKEFIKNIK